MKSKLSRRLDCVRPLDQMEVALVRSLVDRPGWLGEPEAATLRYALNLARIEALPVPGGEVKLEGALDAFRERLVAVLHPHVLETPGVIERHEVRSVLTSLRALTERTRSALLRRFGAHFDLALLDREVCNKALVVVGGGGGGSGYVYAGAYKLLDDLNLEPRLIVGTSMGAVIGLLRARDRQMKLDDLLSLGGRLDFGDVFLLPRMKSRYGVPASLRLYLRRAIAHLFRHPEEDRVLRLKEMQIPLRILVAGIRNPALDREVAEHEHLFDDVVAAPEVRPGPLRRDVSRMAAILAELLARPAGLVEIVLGGDPLTAEFDAIDAAGFSAAVPGLIHYDIVREDPHMHALMGRLFERHRVLRLVDGGVVNNVPSRIAWTEVQRGAIGTRNAFVLALDCFAPQLRRNLMMHPVQRLVRPQVNANAVYASYTKSFLNVLSPLELVPDAAKLASAVRNGYRELGHDRQFLREMLRPLPGLDLEYGRR